MILPEILTTEENFRREMDETVLPYLHTHVQTGAIEGYDGKNLYYEFYRADSPKAVVEVIHGFSEFIGKYHELIYVLLLNGYSVAIAELRGHGRSARSVTNPYIVDIHDFSEYTRDLKCFYDQVLAKEPLSKYLLGHSMGGGIAARYSIDYPKDFERLILSSPMIRMQTGKWPIEVLEGYCDVRRLAKQGTEFATKKHEFDPTSHLAESSCKSEARYEYIMDQRRNDVLNQTWSTDYNWLSASCRNTRYVSNPKHIARIRTAPLLLLAGKDHLISTEHAKTFANQIHGSKMEWFPDARHEIYHSNKEERVGFYESILSFLSS